MFQRKPIEHAAGLVTEAEPEFDGYSEDFVSDLENHSGQDLDEDDTLYSDRQTHHLPRGSSSLHGYPPTYTRGGGGAPYLTHGSVRSLPRNFHLSGNDIGTFPADSFGMFDGCGTDELYLDQHQVHRGILPNRGANNESSGLLHHPTPVDLPGFDVDLQDEEEEYNAQIQELARFRQNRSQEVVGDTYSDRKMKGIRKFQRHHSEDNKEETQRSHAQSDDISVREIPAPDGPNFTSPGSSLTNGTYARQNDESNLDFPPSSMKFYIGNVEVDFETGQPVSHEDAFD